MKIEYASIFPDNVRAGLVTANYSEELEYGESIKASKVHDDKAVINTIYKIAKELDRDTSSLKFQNQIHSDTVSKVDEKYEYADSDAMITNSKDFVLCSSLADCGGVLIYDPVKKTVASVHSGWKGTQQNIVKATLKRMEEEFGSKASDLLVHLTTCASVENYEVGDEFKEYFDRNVFERDGQLYFDNKSEIKDQLLDLGVSNSNIEISPNCSIESKEYHSFRRDGDLSGRMCCFIEML